MKNIIRCLVPIAGLATALPALCAADPAPPPPDKPELRVIAGPDDHTPPPPRREHRGLMPREMESVTFLGVSTSPAGATLADQLDLPKDSGLVVTSVMPDSPAAAVLKRHDVLLKLDDQLLIEQRQLAVLVRNHKEGDEVALTYIRGGKQATTQVKLGKHDVPRMAMFGFGPHADAFAQAFGNFGAGLPGPDREDVDRVLSLIGPDQGFGPGQPQLNVQIDRSEGPEMHTVTVNTSNSNMSYTDEQGSLDLTIKDGKKSLVAHNAKGEQLFSGPVNTPEERKAMPAEVRARLQRLEDMQGFSFKTDGDFKPGETKDLRPLHQGIALPAPAPAEPASPPTPVF